MEPITIIVTAIALGASAGLKPVAEQAVKDAYAGLKSVIQSKYSQTRMGVELIEKDPTSETYKSAATEIIEGTKADKDEEVLIKAQTVLDTVQNQAPEIAAAIGVDLNDIKGASLKIQDIIATGTGVKVNKAEISGDIEIKGVRAGTDEE